MAEVERYPRILATWGSLVALVALGEGRVTGEEKCRAAKGRRRWGSWDDSYQVWGVQRTVSKEVAPQPSWKAEELSFMEMRKAEPRQGNIQMTSQEGGCPFGLSGKRMPNGVRSARDLVGRG